jgi:hypothetical protein
VFTSDAGLRSKIAELNAFIRKADGYRWCATSFIVEKIASFSLFSVLKFITGDDFSSLE